MLFLFFVSKSRQFALLPLLVVDGLVHCIPRGRGATGRSQAFEANFQGLGAEVQGDLGEVASLYNGVGVKCRRVAMLGC